MDNLSIKLNRIREKKDKTKIMIVGLGSVGNYLMDYLMSSGMEDIEIIVAGRNRDKMEQDVNIVRIASLIRGQNRTKISIESDVDLNDVPSISKCISKNQPDIIINQMIEGVHRFVDDAEQSDDMTILAIKYGKRR